MDSHHDTKGPATDFENFPQGPLAGTWSLRVTDESGLTKKDVEGVVITVAGNGFRAEASGQTYQIAGQAGGSPDPAYISTEGQLVVWGRLYDDDNADHIGHWLATPAG